MSSAAPGSGSSASPSSPDPAALIPSDAEKAAVAQHGNFPPVTNKEIFAWCCFDFANSSFTTVVVSVIFALTFTKVIAPQGQGEALWGLALFIAQAVVVIVSPFIGAWADIIAGKKKLLFCSYLTCVLFTALLAFTGPGAWPLAMACFIIAYIAFSMGENFTSSFLPELSTPENIGRISGYGWSFGYLGGLASLGICFPFLSVDNAFSLNNLGNLQTTNIIVAVFFGIAAIPTFLFLNERAVPQQNRPTAFAMFVAIWKQVFATLYKVATHRGLRTAFGSFFVYMCGMCIIIAYAGIYAEAALGMTSKQLIMFFLILQVTSAAGAFLFGFVQDKLGSVRTLQITLVMWTFVVIAAAMVKDVTTFIILGNVAGLVIGSTQAASRALVAQLAPESQHAEYFGLWALFGKLAGGFGPLVFGQIILFTRGWSAGPDGVIPPGAGYRPALYFTTVFFIFGLLWLSIGARDLMLAAGKKESQPGAA